MTVSTTGSAMHALAARLFPICRSLTGPGFRESLRILQEVIPFKAVDVPTGTPVFDWRVPKEWTIRDAYLQDAQGNKIIDFKTNNLHVVGYSIPVNRTMTLTELQPHLYSLDNQPDAIPYVTSYYRDHWGFCLTHRQRQTLKEGNYRVVIDSDIKDGALTYGELIVPGKTTDEVFLSTYLCHPSMANNELSGPVVMAYLYRWIASAPRRYTYRFVAIPETIGSITYLSRNLELMKKRTVAGFNLTCLGDDRAYSYIPSRNGNTLSDKVALSVLQHTHPDFVRYSFLDRGSDERQYCSPGIDLPVVCLCRSKFGAYPEYHTSLDDLSVVTPEGLAGGLQLLQDCITLLEHNVHYRVTCLGEPQLGKRGLYPNTSIKGSTSTIRAMMDFLAYADGTNDLIDIADKIHQPPQQLIPLAEKLLAGGLIEAQSH